MGMFKVNAALFPAVLTLNFFKIYQMILTVLPSLAASWCSYH